MSSEKDTPTLDIVIVNWNSGEQLEKCLGSIPVAIRKDFKLERVVVVDNASTDGSVDGLAHPGLPLVLKRNSTNRGFGAACNQGARNSSADYLLFLNPDTLLYERSLSAPIRFMEQPESSAVGICGVQLVNDKGEVSRSCTRFPRPLHFYLRMLALDLIFPRFFPGMIMTEWDHGQDRVVDQVMGAFLLVRRSLFQELGGFDERYFLYFEDLDFSYRARRSGWKSYYLSSVQAFHRGGGTSRQVRANRLFYYLRSRIQYGYKHFSFSSATWLLLATLLVEPWTRLIQAGWKTSAPLAFGTLSAYWMLLGSLPDVLFGVRQKAS